MPSGVLGRAVGYVDLARHARRARASNKVVRENARRHLAGRMGRLRGLPQKIGQMLSMGGDPAGATPFDALTDHADPLPFSEVEPILRRAWQRDVSAVVRSIDPHGLAASLGQVHRAELLDGRPVAVKVRYPAIRQAVMNDLKVLGWLSVPVGDLRRGFDLAGYREEILRDLEDELDYRVEADHQRRFREMSRDMPGWSVPGVIGEWSGEDVLVSEWLDGDRIEDAAGWPAADRQELARRLLDGFLSMLFRHGVIHADPHPGNYRFLRGDAGPRIVLYDYGSVTNLEPASRLALLRLIEITARREGDPWRPMLALGFNERLLAPIRHKLAALCRALFEPFCCEGKYDLSRWNRARRVEDILGDDRWNFRMSGPPRLIFILRAFRGLTYYLERLGVPVAWAIGLRPHLAGHRAALEAFDVSAPPAQAGTFGGLARHLRIRVSEAGEQKVGLTFLADVVDDLGEIMDDDLRSRVAAAGVDLEEIVRRARRTLYAPQDLFRIEESTGSRGVRVWLE